MTIWLRQLVDFKMKKLLFTISCAASLVGCSDAGFEGYGPKGQGFVGSAYGYEDSELSGNRFQVTYTEIGSEAAANGGFRRARELCAAAGFSGAEYQAQVRQLEDIIDIAEGIAQCGSVDRLTVSSTGSTGSGINLANVSIGQNLSSVSLSGRCGLPAEAVKESARRAWYNESIKGATPGPFQNDSSARAEIMSISTPAGFSSVCEAAAAQVYAFLPSLNQAITSSNRLHNGNGVGLKCGAGGASGSAACTATNITYGLMTTSYMCHQACNAGR
jgi:hypothetical protein